MKELSDLDVAGKVVLVRTSLNVPLSKEGDIVDDFRLQVSLATIQDLVKRKAKIVLLGHLGRPEGEDEKLSLRPVAVRLSELLGKEIQFSEDSIGEAVKERVKALQEGEVVMLENLRFHKEEERNDSEFATSLSDLGDIYVNDAFDVSHRAHASIIGIPRLLPSAIGIQFAKEISVLNKLMGDCPRPLVVVVGGSKVETKAVLVDKISQMADTVLIANLVAKAIEENNITISHPEKIVAAVDDTGGGLDIGPETIELFSSVITTAKTVLWTGPLGQVEEKAYQEGSKKIARAIIASGAYSVVGGGDLDAFLKVHGFRDSFSHVSTGGGALMTYLTGEKLPGLEALKK